ncbi:MAG: hypothetical protein IJ840_07010 [Bacteroidales bacterium]|nr:hypothetical protein [Bacteroidales bacterium]
MDLRRRRLCPDIPNHVCRRPKNHSAIYYCLEDCLVFFTLFRVNAKRFGIMVLVLALIYHRFPDSSDVLELPYLNVF